MRVRHLLILSLAAVSLGLTGCPSCPYDEACEGNTLLTCWLGVDQIAGSPQETSIPCQGDNPVCITVDPRNALCAMDAARTCVVGAAPKCEGDRLVTCQDGFEVARDCAAHGNVCGAVEGVDRCFLAPQTPCDREYESRCEGEAVLSCVGGQVERRDCNVETAGYRCTPFTNDYGSGAYCGS